MQSSSAAAIGVPGPTPDEITTSSALNCIEEERLHDGTRLQQDFADFLLLSTHRRQSSSTGA
jgi:hypothetical protein